MWARCLTDDPATLAATAHIGQAYWRSFLAGTNRISSMAAGGRWYCRLYGTLCGWSSSRWRLVADHDGAANRRCLRPSVRWPMGLAALRSPPATGGMAPGPELNRPVMKRRWHWSAMIAASSLCRIRIDDATVPSAVEFELAWRRPMCRNA
jgi:hypothetical protein